MQYQNNKWFSVIISLLMVGFLLVVTVGVFNLVLRELHDNRGLGNYIKAFAGAEAAQELALLKIKQAWYEYYDRVDFDSNSVGLSNVLVDNLSYFLWGEDVIISYDLNTKTQLHTQVLDKLEYDIIPLFYLTGDMNTPTQEQVSTQLELSVPSGNENDLVWNIVGGAWGISGVGSFTQDANVDEKILDVNGEFSVVGRQVSEILSWGNNNYLILFNSGWSSLEYNLVSGGTEYFTKPRSEIVSSAKVWKYRQNLVTEVNNTQYLNILRYSIYSN